MAKKDYHKMSQSKKNSEVAEELETTIESNTDQETDEELETTPEESKKVLGVATECVKLNVRKEPKKDSEVLCVINAKDEVTIDEDNSTDGWYSVCTSDGINGFCMKDFIAVKS